MRSWISSSAALALTAVWLSACQAARAPDSAPVGAGSNDALPPGVTMQMVARGERLYQGICVACHGAGGVGSPIGPALNDQAWIHVRGEYAEIVRITAEGVPQPHRYPAPMPQRGGGNYSLEELQALGAYVYALSRGMAPGAERLHRSPTSGAPTAATPQRSLPGAFVQAFEACTPGATFTASLVELGAKVRYVILETEGEGCRLSLTFESNPNPAWESKQLRLTLDPTSPLEAQLREGLMSCMTGGDPRWNCAGPLLEVLRQ
jgi:mono/diheme cytochrome c family protein